MTGGTRTMVRCFESVMADTPLADRWDAPEIITTRCLPVDSDRITDMTADEWDAFVAEKYGEDGL